MVYAMKHDSCIEHHGGMCTHVEGDRLIHIEKSRGCGKKAQSEWGNIVG